MEIKINRTTRKVSYRVEPRAGGGFIARSADPGTEAIEGVNKEELFQKAGALRRRHILIHHRDTEAQSN